MNKKYQIDTAENKAFLKDIRNGLLSFGHQFPSPGGGSYYLGDDGTPWKERSRETWITVLSWAMQAAKTWQMPH